MIWPRPAPSPGAAVPVCAQNFYLDMERADANMQRKGKFRRNTTGERLETVWDWYASFHVKAKAHWGALMPPILHVVFRDVRLEKL